MTLSIWHPATDAPPLRGADALVFYLVRTPSFGYIGAWCDEKGVWWVLGGIHALARIDDVTHWMLLPAEPRG